MNYNKIHFFSYLLLILIGSSIPGKAVPIVVALTWDKLLHIIEYFIFGVLGYRAFDGMDNRVVFRVSMGGLLFGCFDEFWQSFIPGRHSSYYDVIADAVGVILGAITMKLLMNQPK